MSLQRIGGSMALGLRSCEEGVVSSGLESLKDSAPVLQAVEDLDDRAHSARGLMLAAVARAIVRIHKQHLGKGPVGARAHLSGDVLTVLLEGGFMRSEQMLQERGLEEEVLRSRLAMQQALKQEFCSAVETILYRPVRSFMSATDPGQGLQVELFVLERETTANAESSHRFPTERGHGFAGR